MAFKEGIIRAKSTTPSLSIWFVHDNKPGHVHQLQGLEERIAHYYEINTHWIDAGENLPNWFDMLLKNKTTINTQDATGSDITPDIVIGAGHKTHKTLLFYAYLHKAYCVVLMRPSLPLYFFDAVICPEHDKLKENKRVMNTCGALNTVKPTKNLLTKTSSLILIGGPSKHFKWQEEDLLAQIKQICKQDNTTQWLLSDSPRTPRSFFPKLKSMNILNLTCFHYQDNNLKPLHKLMLTSTKTWITPDSVSMVYESLTARTPTYTFAMSLKNVSKPSRVAHAIKNLISNKHVISFENWQLHTDMEPNKLDLWEADRAAKWLLNRYFEIHTCKNDV
ncbi:MAG: mitochondrial fission protein ELM1 [Oleiphilaceae bacterium]